MCFTMLTSFSLYGLNNQCCHKSSFTIKLLNQFLHLINNIIHVTIFALQFLICLATFCKHLCSSSLFSISWSSRGYFSWGKGAMGQSKAGMSSLCIGLEWVVERAPIVRPCRLPSKDRTQRSGQPGACEYNIYTAIYYIATPHYM